LRRNESLIECDYVEKVAEEYQTEGKTKIKEMR
jgi:hypothetical protein